ncbi:hypothetical protein AHIS1636_13500 [Arthrobacter mangrovi]|uniref:Uncharacterized protein n=1 Tax=Arthrobacter mangrovi TaxID=2966350 RepID=A0ABQ5MSE2_9MICC|nr:hypothetical protein AHIS1636_13500 [Arthrobacter mangrovi]
MAGHGRDADFCTGLPPQPVRQEDFRLGGPGQFVGTRLQLQLSGCMELRLHVLE